MGVGREDVVGDALGPIRLIIVVIIIVIITN